jgi:hypothetical protein
MQQYKLIGDFEGVVTYGVGVRRLEETAITIQSDPDDPRHSSCTSIAAHKVADRLTPSAIPSEISGQNRADGGHPKCELDRSASLCCQGAVLVATTAAR